MLTPFLSIIIPVYNVEKYINKCLESLYSQDLSEELYEIIIVNDGTPDRSMDIVQQYAETHSNIVVVNQKNQGVSSARNKGIITSNATYLTFVDPDDVIGKNTLQPIYNKLKKELLDILVVRSIRDGKDTYSWLNNVNTTDVLDGISLYRRGYERGSVWGCFYRKEFLVNHDITFPLNVKNSEDTIFFSLCQLHAQTISFANILFNYISIRPGSATTSITESNLVSYKLPVQFLSNYIENKSGDYTSSQLSLLSSYLYILISNWVFYTIKIKDKGLRFLLKRMNIKDFLPIKYTLGLSKSRRRKVRILNISFRLYYFLCWIRVGNNH